MRYHLLLMLLCSSFVMATPFETCSSKAYLFQRKPLVVYELNLLTGNYEQVAGTVASGRNININGLGFDYYFNEQGQSESYFYGFSTTTLEFMRLDKDFNKTTLPLINQPGGSFYVGDVYDHHYYFYRTGSGLYKVNLDDAADNYLEVQTITNTARVQLTDFAFHPDHILYGIDNRSGVLHRFDIETGVATAVGNTGVTGTFGAAYFDSDGYMYISRNQDGHIFRINPMADDVSAEFFAYGPSSNQNDGARCVFADLITEDDTTQYDFGDAPESYGNSIDSNGPRHEFQGELSAPETSTPETSVPEPETPSVTPLTTAEIEAPEGLTFTSAFAMDLSLNLEQYQQQKAYVSVYSDYHQADNNQWQINYNSRVLGSSVNNGVFNKALTLPQHLEKVLVQVWFYDTSIEPLTREVTVAERVGI